MLIRIHCIFVRADHKDNDVDIWSAAFWSLKMPFFQLNNLIFKFALVLVHFMNLNAKTFFCVHFITKNLLTEYTYRVRIYQHM